ncbi:hypothetical protein IMZ29_02910, partial [Achromobacter sp. GG226]|nr:hypothetical protein [Verticiella sp. GG226]
MDGRWWLALLLAIGLLAVLPPASAQAPATSAAPTTADAGSYAGLADILEDDAARTRLVEQLRALANGAPPAAPPGA